MRPNYWRILPGSFDCFLPKRQTAGRKSTPEMETPGRRGYAWAVGAGLNAALAAVSAKLIASQVTRYGLVILFNVTMWGCYVNSLKSLSSLQATVTNFATNFLTSGLAGFFLFDELLTPKWFAGALLIVIGVVVLSKSSIESKSKTE
ncbi:uncharacterized protein LOC116213430 [Punica granatum]|uniref:Uncharacterized protein LOC116213430 n=2 Tax=Punica granatum TaxID=22663 RepID=A0A6P8EFL3_PUNGR|nr:uncharacterized protein LOC116213430 [Punica granatum]